ncbi:MAG: OmpH family outer membrane protein [Chlorobiaceae bacterium]|nr:OmpH family outer membrane protein [Chlorobiaceae bacterium]
MTYLKKLETLSRRFVPAIAFCMLVAAPGAFAASGSQKIGVIDYGKIFQQMPETKTADQSLLAARTQTNNELSKLQAALQNAVQAYQKGGKQNAKKEQELRAQDENFRKAVADKQGALARKEQELVAPIRQKIDAAVESIAKKEGYNMIFDKGVRVYGDAEYDITFKVMDQLNIK